MTNHRLELVIDPSVITLESATGWSFEKHRQTDRQTDRYQTKLFHFALNKIPVLSAIVMSVCYFVELKSSV